MIRSASRIIPIHDYGETDVRFIDMRLVVGRDLAALLAEQGPYLAEHQPSVR
ncbi:MAG TPA: hypothetical protein VGO16_00895 [Pseudonocardiaceae bacterium]|jgi:serine/threonine-protein kinase|nr:hypothetical protein [Pseudonocardiaceae bacterium]